MNILDKIVAYKRNETAQNEERKPLQKLKHLNLYQRECISLKKRLKNQDDPGIIAEFKRKSPSKAQISNKDIKISEVIDSYQREAAAGISVLTDKHFFGAKANDFAIARETSNIPLLRKDFILGEYQIHESKAMGADVILLIAAILSKKEVEALSACAHALGLEVICEVHDKTELHKLNDTIDIVGINNRNLKTFKVDYMHSIEIARSLQKERLCISESGIKSPDIIKTLRKKGFNGFLIGESFMKEKHPGEALKNFMSSINSGP